ncbi:hypothetical protein JCM33374_g5575 [Metschnikowia sp. JCM 33374]|nr:hypothetical protein JCM33374_g5575 [Metschnikowia sp. JCM 33374]
MPTLLKKGFGIGPAQASNELSPKVHCQPDLSYGTMSNKQAFNRLMETKANSRPPVFVVPRPAPGVLGRWGGGRKWMWLVQKGAKNEDVHSETSEDGI